MEAKIKGYFLVLCVLSLFPSVLLAEELPLSFDICFNGLGLRVENTGDYTFLPAFKRGGASCIFLLSTGKGQLFPCRHWGFVPANAYSRGHVHSLPQKGEGPKLITVTPDDLSGFKPSESSLPPPTEFPRLFVQAVIKHPDHGPDGFITSSIHEITVKNRKITEVRKISQETVPPEVLSTFAKELEKLRAEENSPDYGIW
jgi:hypothetical protein